MGNTASGIKTENKSSGIPSVEMETKKKPVILIIDMIKSNNFLEVDKVLKDPKVEIELDTQDGEGNTALYLAISKKQTDIVKQLLQKGADPNQKKHGGDSPLILAVENHGPVEIVELLLNNNRINVNIKNSKDQTALFIALTLGRWPIANALIDMGIDTNIAQGDDSDDKNLITPLIIAVDTENPDMDTILNLLKKGADPNMATNTDGATPLILACERGNIAVVKVLLEKGADPNKADKSGRKPISVAIRNERLNIVEVLIEKGAKTNPKIFDQIALVESKQREKEEIKVKRKQEEERNKVSWYDRGGGRKIRKLYNKRKTRKLYNKRKKDNKSFTKSKNKYSKQYHN